VTGALAAAAPSNCTIDNSHLFNGCGYPAPGLQDFVFRPMFTIGSWGFTKPELLCILCGVLVIGFFAVAFSKPRLVPSRTQSLGELGILAVRDQIIRPALGRRGDSYLPYIASMFFFILICNYMELIPFFQFPVMSRIGFVYPLAIIMYVLYWYQGFKTKGFFGYFRSWIPEAPWPILIILIPVELLKYVIVQPATLAIRLFANMFAGHLLLTIFMLSTWYMLSASIGILYAAGSLFMVFFVFLLEILVGLLQAFIFTTLISTYIADSLEHGH
jgi:F-type H+-transporting ATPase subunit a